MNATTRHAVLVLCTVGLGGCGPSQRAADTESSLVVQSPSATHGDLALRNLDGHIAGLEAAVARNPAATSERVTLVHRLLDRVKVLRSYHDLARAGYHAGQAIERQPDLATAHFARARYWSTIHEFDRARADLERARAGGVDVRYQLASLELASPLTPDRLRQMAAEYRADRTFQGRATAAAIASARGLWSEADQAWREALAAYEGVSPMVIAWVHFERGVMWSERASAPHRAFALYRESVHVLPGYVPAQLHLAELEVAAGEHDQAIARLTSANVRTEDNETPALLAALLQARAPAIAARLHELARARYDRWVRRFPAALSHHAVGTPT